MQRRMKKEYRVESQSYWQGKNLVRVSMALGSAQTPYELA